VGRKGPIRAADCEFLLAEIQIEFPNAPDFLDMDALLLILIISPDLNAGGERGIRTPDTRKGIHAFEARAFSHSAISPRH
jgi:hypothetical protein